MAPACEDVDVIHAPRSDQLGIARIQPDRPVVMGPLSSQTKCNTFLWRCCHGADLPAALPGRSMRDCPAFCQRQLGPANRGSSGSLAINDFSGAEAQSWCPGWVQIQLRSAADAGAALEGLTASRLFSGVSGILGRPVKPGDDM